MSKGAVGLVAGYWPEDIYRYLAIPGLSLDDGVVMRQARRRAEHPALAFGSEAVDYGLLSREVDRTAGLLRGALGGAGNRVALAIRAELELAKVFLGGLKARCVLALLDPLAPREEVEGQLRSFQPDLVIAEEPLASVLPSWDLGSCRTISLDAFGGGERGSATATQRVDLKAPVVALVGTGYRLVYHSHASLLAWAVSWSAFVPLTEESVVLTLEPLYRWEGLLTALAVLFRGGTCVFARPEDAPVLAFSLERYHPGYIVLPMVRALELIATGGGRLAQALRQSVQGAFLTIQRPFAVRERRRVARAWGVPALTLFGGAEAGAVLAAHPDWSLDEAAGIPVTNVDVWPLHPTTRDPLLVPWETIEYGEVGVRSPLVAAEYQTPQEREAWVTEEWVRTGVVATMDPNGLFYLRS